MYHKLIARTTMLGLGVAAFAAALPLTGDDGKQRTIVFNEDRAQHYMTSKVYELKHVSAHDLLPFIKGAVKRFDAQSTVQSLDYKAGDRQFLVVSTGKTMLPYVDQMIAALDYPSKKVDENGTAVSGDGITVTAIAPITAVPMRCLPCSTRLSRRPDSAAVLLTSTGEPICSSGKARSRRPMNS